MVSLNVSQNFFNTSIIYRMTGLHISSSCRDIIMFTVNWYHASLASESLHCFFITE